MPLDHFPLCGHAPSAPLEQRPERVKRSVSFLNRYATTCVVRRSFRVLQSMRVCGVRRSQISPRFSNAPSRGG